MRSLSPDQTTRIITIYNSLKGNLQLTVNEVILADMFHFFSARETPQEDMISEETKTKFSLPKSRKDFSHLIRGDLQKSKSYRDNFKRYSKKKYLLFQFPYFNTSKSVRTASQISLDDQHFGETKHVQVFPQQKNFHKLLRNKSTHSKERKFKRRRESNDSESFFVVGTGMSLPEKCGMYPLHLYLNMDKLTIGTNKLITKEIDK